MYTTIKVNNKVKTTTTTTASPANPTTTTTKKSKIRVTKRNLRPNSKKTKIRITKKLRATTTDTITTTTTTTRNTKMGKTMKKLKAKVVTKIPETGETVKKLKAKEIIKKSRIEKFDSWRFGSSTMNSNVKSTMNAMKMTKEPVMETSMKSGGVKRNLKVNSTMMAMKKTMVPGMRKSMKPRATLKVKRMTMKPGKGTAMRLGGERIKRQANETEPTEGNPEPEPTTSAASGQKCLFPLSLFAVVSIVMKSI